ncbi:TadE family protein [Bifidobacterium myosotis]|uniref:TadE family protein n=1 Tax=Bifidobacterium myosotis TaxID=1630166 RepID=A0A261FIK5_9BIFI|nr:TadE/TadG family type IV pilus assembly protein [Bifidobacterium myosotis]OZG58994.1 TadE family protein [Bifidobacterium myosotis]
MTLMITEEACRRRARWPPKNRNESSDVMPLKRPGWMGHDSVSAVSARASSWWERGSATAEFSMVLPSVIVIASLLLALGRVVSVSMDCHSAAAAAAREFVVFEDAAAARTVAADIAGDGVATSVQRESRSARVLVECSVLPGPLNLTPTRIKREAVAVLQ